MAQQLTCDICGAEPGVQTLTVIETGQTIIIGAACLGVFYAQSALLALDAGEHKGPAGKCQACRRFHERVTTPAATAAAPAGDEAAEETATASAAETAETS